jgi:hypothetical protein
MDLSQAGEKRAKAQADLEGAGASYYSLGASALFECR